MTSRLPLSTLLCMLTACVLASGCSLMPWSSDSPRQELNPTDFSAGNGTAKASASTPPAEPAPTEDESTTAISTTEGADADPATPATPPGGNPRVSPELQNELDRLTPPNVTATPSAAAGKEGQGLTLNAMIGQVNGRPIYASDVLDPLKAQFTAMGQQMSLGEFRSMAGKILAERLYQIIFDALFLAEAERRLTEQQRFQLKVMMHLNRQELIRKYGAGSEPAANEEMIKKTGRDMETTLESIRQTILVKRYQEEVIYPKIAVSKRDIERFYNRPQIYAKYNPKPGRKVRRIMVSSKDHADKVDEMFAEGKSFIEIAKSEYNRYNRDSGGKMTLLDENKKETDILVADTKLFEQDVLNEALAKLKPGEHSPRLEVTTQFGKLYMWILLEEVIQSERKSLPEVQLEIELQIRALQYTMIEQRYRKKLFEEAGYVVDGSTQNPMEEMADSLVKIAIGLYHKGQ